MGVQQGEMSVSLTYDGDGNRVRSVVSDSHGVTTTVHIGGYYGVTNGVARSCYHHCGQRVAMREAGVTTWLLGDHLGSTSVTYRQSDGHTVSQRYHAWGTVRPGPGNALPTDYAFTGQQLVQHLGLMYYGARWYDPALGRFISPDTIVPNAGNPQDLNRFSYVRNNPLKYTDPSGHVPWAAIAVSPTTFIAVGLFAAYAAGYLYSWGPDAAANRAALADAVEGLAARLTSATAVAPTATTHFALKGPARPIAKHLQKLSAGELQFPRMPPLDPDEHKNKRPDGGTDQHWLRETNTHLREYVRKYPGQTLEKILQKHAGYSAEEAASYVRTVSRFARDWLPEMRKMPEVDVQALKQFETLLKQLGVTAG